MLNVSARIGPGAQAGARAQHPLRANPGYRPLDFARGNLRSGEPSLEDRYKVPERSRGAAHSTGNPTQYAEPVSTFTVRRARTADVPGIIAVVEPYVGERILLGKERVEFYEAIQEFMVAEADGLIIGCGALHVMWEDLGEVRYGDWTGKKYRQLRRTRLWKVIQGYPSGARFPNGESIREVQARVVSALEKLAERHTQDKVAVVAHADVLKLALAHYIGMPLDLYQRLTIAPASLSMIWLGRMGPRVILINDTSHYARDER